MRLAVVNLTSGGFSGGYEKYLQQILPILHADGDVSKMFIFMPPTRRMGMISEAGVIVWPRNDRFWGHRFLKKSLKERSVDVVFFPTARWVNTGGIPAVVMVRNMEPLIMPWSGHNLLARARNMGRAIVARRACDRASRIIAVSDFVKDRITNLWNIDSSRIGVVYHGCDGNAETTSPARPATLDLGDGELFIATAGSIRPARGLEDLIEAMPMLRSSHPGLKLVIAGQSDSDTKQYERHLHFLADRRGVASAIRWVGRASRAEMNWCFARCRAFVLTTRVEACPNTALEAMAHGCAIVAAECPPMPEVLRECATYYPAGNAGCLAEAIERTLGLGEDARSVIRRSAQRRAGDFTWDRCAAATIRELKMAIASP